MTATEVKGGWFEPEGTEFDEGYDGDSPSVKCECGARVSLFTIHGDVTVCEMCGLAWRATVVIEANRDLPDEESPLVYELAAQVEPPHVGPFLRMSQPRFIWPISVIRDKGRVYRLAGGTEIGDAG